MTAKKLTLSILLALLLIVPAINASTVTYTVEDTLGPVITSDPLALAGGVFTLTGTTASGVSGQTVYMPETLSVTASALGITETLIACGTPGAPSTCSADTTPPSLTITGDSATLLFDVSVIGQLASLDAVINLPAGSFQDSMGNVSLENLTGVTIQPGSTLSYSAMVLGTAVTGEVGISGTTTVSGVAPSGPPPAVPEPGTLLSLAGGLIVLGFHRKLRNA
jgi:PEP-CTERM motif